MKYGDKLCDRKMLISNLIGTEFHRCAEEMTQGKQPVARCPRVKKMVGVFKREWFDKNAIAPFATEMKVWSRKYKYQGTFDLVAEVNGVLKMVDYKSSSGIQKSMPLQLAAYAQAYGEMTGVFPKVGDIVLVKKDKPDFKFVNKEYDLTREEYMEEFLQLRQDFVEMPCPYKS